MFDNKLLLTGFIASLFSVVLTTHTAHAVTAEEINKIIVEPESVDPQVGETIWTPTFYAIQPREDVENPVSMAFCLAHVPNTLRTTVSQIKQGMQAENGVFIKYLSYETSYQHGLGFNTVDAEVWLEDDNGNKVWSSPLWEYQQNLSDTGVTNVVWATEQCKGKFVGVSDQA